MAAASAAFSPSQTITGPPGRAASRSRPYIGRGAGKDFQRQCRPFPLRHSVTGQNSLRLSGKSKRKMRPSSAPLASRYVQVAVGSPWTICRVGGAGPSAGTGDTSSPSSDARTAMSDAATASSGVRGANFPRAFIAASQFRSRAFAPRDAPPRLARRRPGRRQD